MFINADYLDVKPNMKKSLLIAIVGIDCSGKSTQIERMRKHYLQKNLRVKTVSLQHKPTVSIAFGATELIVYSAKSNGVVGRNVI